ncbi:K02A2.6-like, partial [Cordylochernes scorpioides]
MVCGLYNAKIQNRILSEGDISLAKVIEIALSMEAAEKNTKLFHLEQGEDCVDKLRIERKVESNFQNGKCKHCGKPHKEPCRFKEAICFKCNKKGHIASICWSSRRNLRQHQNQPGNIHQIGDQEEEKEYVQKIISVTIPEYKINFASSDPPYLMELKVEGNFIKFEMDTGSGLTLISEKDFKNSLQHLKLEKASIIVRTYDGTVVPILGKINVKVECQDITYTLRALVVKGEKRALMGREWINRLKLGCFAVKHMPVEITIEEILKENQALFAETTEPIKGFTFSVNMCDVNPIFHKARPVPFAIRPAVTEALDKMVAKGYLCEVASSKWATPVVVVPKKNKEIRICCDFKVTLNKYLDTAAYPLPTQQDLFSTLAKGKYFSKLDLRNAYLQLEVDPGTRPLLTINTHKGLFRFKRMPFGLANAPSYFQSVMDRVLSGIGGVICYIDDVLIATASIEEHLALLKTIFARLAKYNIKLKKEKCLFLQKEIEYLGHLVTEEGIRPLDHKVQAIQKAKTPTNISELRSFLGLVNFYGKFIPNLPELLKPLHELLHKKRPWVWTKECGEAIDKCKNSITSERVLVPYDATLPLCLATDASQIGVGAVLSHIIEGQERPIMFASRTLSVAEQNYSQIEKEALAIIYGVTKFHQFIYGRKFILITDHKPLVTILGSRSGIPTLSTSRLQRWALILSAYTYDIKFRRTQDHGNADLLSRFPVGCEEIPRLNNVYALSFVEELPITAEEIATETEKDEVLSLAKFYTQQGWPEKVADHLRPYFQRKLELTVDGECLVWGMRVVIPPSLRIKMLNCLHETHSGMNKMKAVARSHFWWPNLDTQIEFLVNKCRSCQQSQDGPNKGKWQPWKWSTRPWQRIHIDFANKENINLLIVVDSHSKWIEAIPMRETTTRKTIEQLRRLFSSYGLPEELVSDNGPQFTGSEMKGFLEGNGIKQTLIPAYHPQSNGLAERAVRTIKTALDKNKRKIGDTIQDTLSKVLLAYRSTPHVTTGKTPSELFIGRALRTRVSLIHPSLASRVRDQQARQMKYDRRTHLEEFQIDDLVWCKNFRGGDKWIPGKIVGKKGTRVYTILIHGQVKAYHRDQIRKRWRNGEEDESGDGERQPEHSRGAGPNAIISEVVRDRGYMESLSPGLTSQRSDQDSEVQSDTDDGKSLEPLPSLDPEALKEEGPVLRRNPPRARRLPEIKDLESEKKAIVESKNIHGLKLFQQEVNERKISVNQVINTLLESELDDTQHDDYSKAKKDIFNMLVSIEEALSLIETKENTHSDKQLPESNVNLPKINLPIFNGDSANWLSFREIFNSTINSNQTLTEIQKFQYLNASVKGPAEKLIRGFPISDKNYQQAWDTLCNRFNNRRELAFSQINKIFSIRPLKSITTGSLYEILDVCNEGIRNLSVLGLEKNTLTDLILINFFEKRIGEALRKEWELTLQNEEYPTFENFVNFLEKHAKSLQGMRIPLFQEQKTSSKNMMAHGLYVNKGQNCILCHQIHKLNDCQRFINLPLPKKWELVKKHKLCQNCLRANHEISKCLITSRCKNCKQNHHTLLHEYNSEPSIPQPTTSQEMLISTNTICNAMPLETETNILLSTALIKVKAKDGSFVLCRALVDNGSQISLISEQCCHKLGLEKRKNSYTLKGVGDIVVNRTTSQVEIEFTPHHNDQLFSARAFVVGRVTADLPNFQIQSADFPHLENLLLADPEFYVTKPIDLILGADTFVEIILGHKTDLKHHPIALNTKLGWLVSGRIHSTIKSNTSVINHCTTELDSSIRKFWELEDVPISKAQLGTKNACEILFKSNLKRDIEGRYSVNLPFKSTPNLGDSRSQALEKGLQEIPSKSEDNSSKSEENLSRSEDNPSKSEEIPSKSEKSRISKLTPQITTKQNQLLPSESSQPSTPEQLLASQSSEPLSSKKETSIIPKIKPPPYYRRKRQLPAEKTSWDEPIESDIKSNWNKFQTQLSCLKEIKIPRYLNSSSSEIEELQLHGFCDASLNAYSAVFYLKTRFKIQKIKINLITSKTKVAPLKTITIPRLELSAALLLAQLNQVILESFPFQPDKTFLWTDSQICIDWIRSDASRWKAFVLNRVSSIQNLTQITDWFHVSSQDNPADCASRGIMPQDLVNHRIWWRGPIWLQENNVRYIPSSPTQVNLNIIQEEVDTQGLLRVGGRLKYSYLNENQKFPLLQPKSPRQESLIKNLLTENADIPEAIDENQEDSSILETTFVIEDEESNKDIGTPKIEISEVSVIDNSEGKYSKEPVVSAEALDKKELCHDDSAHLNVVKADLNRPKEATSGIINVSTEANESASKEKAVSVEIVDTSTKDYLQSGEKAKLSRWKPIDSLCLEDVKESEDYDEKYSSSAYIEWPEILKKEVLRPEALEKAVNLEDFEKAAESRQLSKEHLEESTEQGSCIKAESKPWEDPIESDLAAAEAPPGFTPLYQLCLGGILQFLFIFVLAIVSISLKSYCLNPDIHALIRACDQQSQNNMWKILTASVTGPPVIPEGSGAEADHQDPGADCGPRALVSPVPGAQSNYPLSPRNNVVAGWEGEEAAGTTGEGTAPEAVRQEEAQTGTGTAGGDEEESDPVPDPDDGPPVQVGSGGRAAQGGEAEAARAGSPSGHQADPSQGHPPAQCQAPRKTSQGTGQAGEGPADPEK